MKRGKLNAAIDAAPTVFIRTSKFGPIALQKGSVKEAIASVFPNRGDETGLKLDGDNCFASDTEPSE